MHIDLASLALGVALATVLLSAVHIIGTRILVHILCSAIGEQKVLEATGAAIAKLRREGRR